ncbi:MAG: type II toxin-antitoxin system VapC family toxin [Candidatus Omnitrophota bacterium]
MILYLDTSALLKKYFHEEGSEDVISRWRAADEIVTSCVTFAETLASIHRKQRESETTNSLLETVIDSFKQDWTAFYLVEVANDLNDTIEKVLAKHPLRGFDAIHLASALIIRDTAVRDFTFACYDRRLSRAARSEGLNIFPGRIS